MQDCHNSNEPCFFTQEPNELEISNPATFDTKIFDTSSVKDIFFKGD